LRRPGADFDPADDLLNEIAWPLTELAARGFDGTCLVLG